MVQETAVSMCPAPPQASWWLWAGGCVWESSSPLSQGHPLCASQWQDGDLSSQSCGSQDLAGQVSGFGV